VRLAWHIAKKDLRRMAAPVAVWLVLIAAAMALFSWSTPEPHGHAGSEIDAWVSIAAIWTRLFVAAQFVIAWVLTGAMVLEDPLVGTDGFWMTRAIGGRRMLAGKLMAAGILFVLGPLVILIPVWWASGYTLGEGMSAVVRHALIQTAGAIAALAVGSLARNLVQFLFLSVGLIVAWVFVSIGMVSWAVGQWVPFVGVALGATTSEGLAWPVSVGVTLAMGAVLVLQFLTRNARRSGMMLGGLLLGVCALNTAYSFSAGSARAGRPEQTAKRTLPLEVGARIFVPPTFSSYQQNSLPFVKVEAPWTSERFYLPLLGTDAEGRVVLRPGSNLGHDACLRTLGFEPGSGPLSWQLTFYGRMARDALRESALVGELEIWAARIRTLGEMPLQIGARLKARDSNTRIAAFTLNGERLDEIFVEERGASPGWNDEPRYRDLRSVAPDGTGVDCYVLVNRARNRAHPLSASQVGAVELHARRIQYRRLSVPNIDWSGAVLVKMRIEREERFQHPVEINGVDSPIRGTRR
jgi:hypothetical protein